MQFALVTIGLAGASPATATDSAREGLDIARKLDKANEGFETDLSTVEMILINAHGDRVERKMTVQTLEGEKDGDKSIIVFSSPADVNGTKLLTWTHKSDNDDQWLYMPAIKRVKRISSHGRSGAFMGSEFAYEDMSSQEVEKYTYKYLGEDTVEGRMVWKLERVPVGKSGYSHQIGYFDQEYMNPLLIEYFDKKNELLKVATLSEFEKFGNLWRAGTITMSNKQTAKKSILIWKSRKLGEDLDTEDFESDALED